MLVYLPKDFVVTSNGLGFAVVSEKIEQGRVIAYLRYHRKGNEWCKLNSENARQLLKSHYPGYLFDSLEADCELQGVPLTDISRHYSARQRIDEIRSTPSQDLVLQDLQELLNLMENEDVLLSQVGISGSVLLNAQHVDSDLDLVIYDRNTFHVVLKMIQKLIAENKIAELNENDWLEAYQRRGCELGFASYLWHERRKFLKFMINRRKVDISLMVPGRQMTSGPVKKIGLRKSEALVIDDSFAFDFPAEYRVLAEDFDEVICFTATYLGQARAGETIEVAGCMESMSDGRRRMVVGADREARGEYIKVIGSSE